MTPWGTTPGPPAEEERAPIQTFPGFRPADLGDEVLWVTVGSPAELWLGGGAGCTGDPRGPSSTSPPSVCKLLGSIRCPSLPGSLRPSEERPERPAPWACSDPGPTCSVVCGCAGLGWETPELWGPLPRPVLLARPQAQVGSGPSRVMGVPGFPEASRTESSSAHALSSPGTTRGGSATPSLPTSWGLGRGAALLVGSPLSLLGGYAAQGRAQSHVAWEPGRQ